MTYKEYVDKRIEYKEYLERCREYGGEPVTQEQFDDESEGLNNGI